MKLLVVLLGLVCCILPAYAAAPPEVMAALRASPFREYVQMEGRTDLLGTIQTGKRKFWVVASKIPGLKHSAAGRLFCRLVFLEEKSGRPSYLGYYGYDCEEIRVNGQRVESFAPKDDGTPRWLGFTLTEKGPPPGFYNSPEFYPFVK
jgi:hypothetical protein